MDDGQFSLSPAMVDVAFPFHLVFCYAEVNRVRDAMVGSTFSTLFEVATPKIGISFEAFVGRPRSLFLLRSLTQPGLLLRGQMLHDENADCVFFVGSPWLTQTSAFASLTLGATKLRRCAGLWGGGEFPSA